MSGMCLDDAVLLDIAEGRRSLDATAEAHLAICNECRLLVAAVARGVGDTRRSWAEQPAGEPAWDELGAGVVVAGIYVLERFLGSGSMGVVWAARRSDTGERVALKIARGSDSELFRRFEREARITATLDHPNILRTLEVIGASAARGTVLVLPLLSGESLESTIAREKVFRLDVAARLVLPIAAALGAAHARGIVHRDLKPQNVFLTPSRVVVLDFGIAKLMPEWGPHTKLTRTGALLGTPRYMAPEQLFGEPEVDARADIWALGVILYRLLAGRFPLQGSTLGELLKELRRGTVEDLSTFAPNVPADVLDLVRRMLIVSRTQRFGDVGAAATVLSRHVA